MILSENRKGNFFSVALPVALGIFSFFLVVGPRALNPQNIAWLGAGDPAAHYLGWLFYRDSGWEFPVGLNPSYGLEIASAILYSDSNPLLAFIFKPFSFLLPRVFQYFGMWLLLCFILQALFASKLVGLVTHSNMLRLLGAGLIVFAPPMIWRLHGHLNLVGHFIVVASLYFALDRNLCRRKLSWGVLLAIAALVHVYFLAMVLAVWIADLAGRTIKTRVPLRSSIYEFVTLGLLVALLCWQAGYFSIGSGVSSVGFGTYRMNLLSPVDSSGWSYVLKDFPESVGEYEGFNYLGLGTIFLLILVLPFFMNAKEEFLELSRRYWYLIVLFFSFFLFAISNYLAIGAFQFKYPLPDSFLQLANVFRASGRMFWPLFYAVTFFSISCVIRKFSARTAGILLGVALLVQIIDTSAGWLPIREKNMVESSSEWASPLINQFWFDASKRYKKVRRIPIENQSNAWQTLAYYAGKNGLSTDAVYLARVGSASFQRAQERAAAVLKTGVFDRDSLYILDDPDFRAAVVAGNPNVDLFAKIDGFNVVAPGWKVCVDCRFFGQEIRRGDLLGVLALGERIVFGSPGHGVNYLFQGWSSPEAWGTWSDSSSSVVFLPIAPKGVDSVLIEFNALITPSHSSQRVGILVNGIQAFSSTIREPSGAVEVKLPEAAKSDSFTGIKIEFLLPDAAKPSEVGLGGDGRTLALGLRAITLR